ncbi:MAG: tetratricopeptide repeat protein [Polyangia bacterium]|nr:tetratricopeptide repeat protein [Polyangia bacterium]
MFRNGIPRILLVFALGASATVTVQLLAGLFRPDEELDPALLILTALGTLGAMILDISRSGRRVLDDFRRGRFEEALRGTRFLSALTWQPASKAALRLNMAACHLAAGRYDAGEEALASLDRSVLPSTLQAVWDNNKAYAILATGGDAAAALALSDRAAAENSSNPAFRSTRGIAHLALGNVEDAIAELQAAVDAGSRLQGPSAMSENYFHLARAWEARGEHAYARDHFLKSVNVCPDCRFARKSAERLVTEGRR